MTITTTIIIMPDLEGKEGPIRKMMRNDGSSSLLIPRNGLIAVSGSHF